VRSSLPTGRKDPAPLAVSCQTKTESTVEALVLMRAIMAELAVTPVPPAEFAAARGALANGFVRGFATREAVVTALMELEFDGRPADFYQTYLDRIRAVTPEEVRRLAETLFAPERLITVLIGEVEAFAPELSGMGRVETRALPEPEFD
jgi:zinc protease